MAFYSISGRVQDVFQRITSFWWYVPEYSSDKDCSLVVFKVAYKLINLLSWFQANPENLVI